MAKINKKNNAGADDADKDNENALPTQDDLDGLEDGKEDGDEEDLDSWDLESDLEE